MSFEILIIDDNSDIRLILDELITEAGYKTRMAANYNQALTEIDKKLPDVAIIDVKLDKGDNDGIELLTHIKKKNNDIPVIIISGHANIDMAIKSLKSGAFEFIQKPFDKDRLLNFIKRAVENINLKNENSILKNKLFHTFEIIGESENILSIKEQIEKIGFENAASRYSVSASSVKKGDLGWINEKSINTQIYKLIKDLNIGDIAKPIKSFEKAIFYRLSDKKISKVDNLDLEKLKKNLIIQKQNELLNFYSANHLSKIKNNSLIEYK